MDCCQYVFDLLRPIAFMTRVLVVYTVDTFTRPETCLGLLNDCLMLLPHTTPR